MNYLDETQGETKIHIAGIRKKNIVDSTFIKYACQQLYIADN